MYRAIFAFGTDSINSFQPSKSSSALRSTDDQYRGGTPTRTGEPYVPALLDPLNSHHRPPHFPGPRRPCVPSFPHNASQSPPESLMPYLIMLTRRHRPRRMGFITASSTVTFHRYVTTLVIVLLVLDSFLQAGHFSSECINIALLERGSPPTSGTTMVNYVDEGGRLAGRVDARLRMI